MSRTPMRHADAAWLRMDTPTNLMVVNSVMWFDEAMDLAALRAVLADRLVARFPRFRQRVVEDEGHWWEDDSAFDLDRHLRVEELPAPGGRAELEAFVAGHLTTPLDPSRPLWELYVLDGYQGGSALFFRMHHCIADGIALTRVMLSLADRADGEVSDVAVQVGPPETADGSGIVGQVAGGVLHEAVTLVRRPWHLVDLTQTAYDDAVALAKLVLLPPDGAPWRRRTGLDKQVVWSDPIPLDRVVEVAHASSATVNDLLLAAVAGALRTGLERDGHHPHDLRAVVPFNLRPLDQPLPADLGNRFGLVFLSLPVAQPGRQERLAEMHRRMKEIKSSAEGVVSYGILDVVGQAPSVIEKVVVDLFATKASAVMTNVPGPTAPVTIAGRTLRGTIGWVPMSGNIGLGVSIFSYHGEITVGLSVDTFQVEDAQALLDDFTAELHRFLR